MQQWQGYDEIYDNLATWVKETEVKVRNESGPQADLHAKQDQNEVFKVIDKCGCSYVNKYYLIGTDRSNHSLCINYYNLYFTEHTE